MPLKQVSGSGRHSYLRPQAPKSPCCLEPCDIEADDKPPNRTNEALCSEVGPAWADQDGRPCGLFAEALRPMMALVNLARFETGGLIYGCRLITADIYVKPSILVYGVFLHISLAVFLGLIHRGSPSGN